MKKLLSTIIATFLAISVVGSGGIVSALSNVNSEDNSFNDEYSLSGQLPYYETAFNNYSAPAIALETLSYIKNSNPVLPKLKQITYAISMDTTKTDTDSQNLINFINSHQDKVKYVRATFTNQEEYEECIRQSLKNFDAPVIIRQREAVNGTMGEYMAITHQYNNDNGKTTYYLNDPNWKYNAGWSQHSHVNPEKGWVMTSAISYQEIMRTSNHELYICQTPNT